MSLTYTPRRLAQVAPSSTAETSIYTVPGSQLTIVKQIMVSNVVPGSVTVSISIVPIGAVAGVTNRVVDSAVVPGKSVLIFDLSQVMETGDFISVKVDAGDAATFTISGVETTIAELPAAGLQLALDDDIIGTRPRLHLHESQFIDIETADDPTAGEIDLTIKALPQSHVHNQAAPANPWVINHALGFYPNVTVVDSGGAVVEGDITYPSISQVQVAFAGAFSGMAYLS